MYYVYILYSPKYDRYYVGHTNDVSRRLEQHNNDVKMTYTHKFRPWRLKTFFEIDGTRGDAVKLERYIKKLKSRNVIKRLVEDADYFIELAQLVGVPTGRD